HGFFLPYRQHKRSLLMVEFRWKKEEPKDFIVKEVAEYPLKENGKHYLYLLVKRNLTTKELSKLLGFSYAGMKDKVALTSQFVSFETFVGESLRERIGKDGWFILKFLGRIQKKIKIGQLKGNKFAVRLKGLKINDRSWFINYYDVQRIYLNRERGKELLKRLSLKPRKRLKWSENFYIDAFLSFLWNKSLEYFLMEKFDGYYIKEKEELFFIPKKDEDFQSLPKFWTILGYKKKLLDSEKFYEKVLSEEGFSKNEFLELLRKLGIKGDYRMTYILVKDFKKIGDYIFFYLPKGSYATMYLKHLQEK
ncbi:MAG: tRNA pseudouridine(13) synthase TruD, partial [Desulfurobacteriaceae bacterium]